MAPNVGKVTCLLAEMQTRINAAGLRSFDGDVDRFAIFSLIVRESLQRNPRGKAISTHSLAISLSRSFETVRRHVLALIAAGLCVRSSSGVVVRAEVMERPDIAALMRLAHDSFVCFAEGLVEVGGWQAVRAPATPYTSQVGIAAAVDIMLAATDSNRAIHRDWLDLVLFSTVLYANLQRSRAAGAAESFGPDHAVRPAALAQAMHLPETTVRRRLTFLAGDTGSLTRVAQGYMVSHAWMAQPSAIDTSARTYATIRLIMTQAVANGFPIAQPGDAYLDGRPSAVALV
jgi:hypothetical protein